MPTDPAAAMSTQEAGSGAGTARARLSVRDRASIGVLATTVTADMVQAVLARHGITARRSDATLPPQVMVYAEMALWLFPGDDYAEVMAKVTGSFDELGAWNAPWSPSTSSAVTKARKKTTPAVMGDIFADVARPLAHITTPGAWLGQAPGRTWRMLSIDGADLDLPDTKENVAAFGRAGSTNAKSSTSTTTTATATGSDDQAGSAFAKARVLTITETATGAPLAAAIGAWNVGEATLAAQLYPQLGVDEVLICDRNFYSYQALSDITATGADVIFRVSATVGLPVVQVLADGSYLSLVYPATLRSAKRRPDVLARARAGEAIDPDSEGRLVRVVEYDITDRDKQALGGPAGSELITLVTSITEVDPHADGVSATGLAWAYAQRWEHEGSFKDAKTTLMDGRAVLHSRSPQLATQEIWGWLLTHYALCALAFDAAHAAQLDPDRISFVRTLRLARRSATGTAGFPP